MVMCFADEGAFPIIRINKTEYYNHGSVGDASNWTILNEIRIALVNNNIVCVVSKHCIHNI